MYSYIDSSRNDTLWWYSQERSTLIDVESSTRLGRVSKGVFWPRCKLMFFFSRRLILYELSSSGQYVTRVIYDISRAIEATGVSVAGKLLKYYADRMDSYFNNTASTVGHRARVRWKPSTMSGISITANHVKMRRLCFTSPFFVRRFYYTAIIRLNTHRSRVIFEFPLGNGGDTTTTSSL